SPTGSTTLTPLADTYVDSSVPTSNFGNSANLPVTASRNTNTLIKFDLTNIPPGSIINRAELHLHQSAATGGAWQLTLARVTQDWDVNKVTWNTRPPSTIYATDLATPSAIDINVSWDVTSLVRDWLYQPTIAPNFGLELSGVSNAGTVNQRVFDSQEGKN